MDTIFHDAILKYLSREVIPSHTEGTLPYLIYRAVGALS